MSLPHPARTHVFAVLLATVAALFARAWLQLRLVNEGFERGVAVDLSYFVVPPILLLLLFPVLYADRGFIRQQFRLDGLPQAWLLKAIAIGVLFRIAWHGQVVAGVAFGFYSTSPIQDAGFAYDCPDPHVLGLSVLVSAGLIPFIEEITHRSYIQSFFSHRGALVAITLSSLIFMAFHSYGAWQFVLPSGMLLGTLYWITGSVWSPVIVHSVINLVPQLTLRCMTIPWSPNTDEIPVWNVGLLATLASLLSVAGILWLTASLKKRRDL